MAALPNLGCRADDAVGAVTGAPLQQLAVQHRPEVARPRRPALPPHLLGGEVGGQYAHREFEDEVAFWARTHEFFAPPRFKPEVGHDRQDGNVACVLHDDGQVKSRRGRQPRQNADAGIEFVEQAGTCIGIDIEGGPLRHLGVEHA